MRYKVPFIVIVWAMATLSFSGVARAQNVSAALSGSVQDSSGAAVVGQEITVTNAQQGFVRRVKTNPDGFFSFPDLTPATYTLAIAAPGFKGYSQSEIKLAAGDSRALGALSLQVGDVAETVTVTAESAPVQLGSSEKGASLTNDEIQGMALRGRDFMDAVGLMAGVVDTTDSREAPGFGSISGISIAGGRDGAKNMTIDGVSSLNTGSNTSVHNMPSMGSIGEVKVLMSNYAAEFGRNSGGSIIVVTRGGGRDYRGSAGWYWRHESLSANDFFANRNGQARPPYRFNIADYNINGPIFVPGKWNRDRSKIFFFWSQEFQRQKNNWGTKQVTVPTALERAGDYSKTFDVNNKLISIYDPANGKSPFPGNIIPPSRVNPLGQQILGRFPLPNFVDPDPSRRYQWNYIATVSTPYPRRTEIGRIDYSPRDNVQLNFRASHNAQTQSSPWGFWSNGSVNYPLSNALFDRPARGFTARSTVTVSPTVFNEFTFGVSQSKNFFDLEDLSTVTRDGTGIALPSQWNPSLNPRGILPNMTFGGVANAVNPSVANILPYYDSDTIFTFVDNVSKVTGTHTIKAGIYVERARKDQNASVPIMGSLAFDRDGNNPLDSNYGFSNALLGNYDRYSEPTGAPRGKFRFTNLEGFVQDAWRVTPRLMIDLGVRMYHDMPHIDQRGLLSNFVPSLYNPANAPVLLRPGYDANKKKVAVDPLSGQTYSSALIGTFVPGVGNPADGMARAGTNGLPDGLYGFPAISFAPRVGFAWDPSGRGRTAVRGGFGMFYDRIAANPIMGTYANPPNVYTPTVYFGTIADLSATSGKAILAPSNVTGFAGQGHLPTTYNYSMGVQHQLSRTMILDVSYVGNFSRHLMWTRQYNQVAPYAKFVDIHPENLDATTGNAYADNFLRPYQGYGNINQQEFAATSNYNSLQATFTRRMSHGISFGAAYTFSKVLGTASGDGSTVSSFFDPRSRNYGPLSNDRSQVASVRINYQVPRLGRRLHLRAVSAVTDGWEIASIGRFMTGAPFTPGYALVSWYDPTGSSEGARIDVVDPSADPKHRFGPPQRLSFGNAGTNILRGPGIDNWDISMYRQIKLAEKRNLQLRFETYNTFNHTQFSNLNTTARFDAQKNQVDPLFLEPSSSRSPRRVQLAARFNW